MSGAAAPPPAQGVGGGKAPMSAPGKAGVVAGVVAVLGVLYWMGSGPGGRPAAEDLGGSGGAAGAMRQVMLPPPDPPTPPPQAAPIAPAPAFAPLPRRPARQPEKQKAAPIMAFEDRADGPARAGVTAAAREGDGGPAEDGLGERLRATRTEAVRAKRLRDRDLTLTLGAVIPCTRKTPVNTQLPGFVLCETPEAVQGASGNVDVLPAKTKIVGQIQRAMLQGTDRAFILWTRLETPDGVTVELASPGADALGMAGVPVEVHTNFWARFGGAVMLSFIDAGLQAAAIAASDAAQPSGGGGGQRLNFFQLQSGGRGAAARALDATVDIPPFGTAPHGVAEAVFLARDIDFTPVYRLRRTGP